MTAKFSTNACAAAVPEMLRIWMRQEPASTASHDTLYVFTVGATPPTLAALTSTMSVAEMLLLVIVKLTDVLDANDSLLVVICPHSVFIVTPVDLLVN
jgi:hypothetical protein